MKHCFVAVLVCICVAMNCGAVPAQDDRRFIDKSAIPASGAAVGEFCPPGWIIEEQIEGDLNNDGIDDLALKLIERTGAREDATADNETNRYRALVVLLRSKDGQLHKAAVADRLLQCTDCGGAFYGVVEAPANVRIAKGVLIVSQDHGSREVTETVFRFRLDPKTNRFVLIGSDITTNDRATGTTEAQSTNFLTGKQVTEKSRFSERTGGNVRISSTAKQVATATAFIDEVDYESYD